MSAEGTGTGSARAGHPRRDVTQAAGVERLVPPRGCGSGGPGKQRPRLKPTRHTDARGAAAAVQGAPTGKREPDPQRPADSTLPGCSSDVRNKEPTVEAPKPSASLRSASPSSCSPSARSRGAQLPAESPLPTSFSARPETTSLALVSIGTFQQPFPGSTSTPALRIFESHFQMQLPTRTDGLEGARTSTPRV